MLHVVLYRPEIPPNTGNIARQCVGMNAHLHIIGPTSIDLGHRAVRRAGLDYWDRLSLTLHESSGEFLTWLGKREPWVATRQGTIRYDRPSYADGDILLFGNETGGLPEEFFKRWQHRSVFVPMIGRVRNYNLANTVSVILAHATLKAGLYDVRG